MEKSIYTFFKKNRNSIILFLCTYCFLIILNVFFPTQSDDIGRSIGGIKDAVTSYMEWNGRLGELFLVSFGSWFSTTFLFSFVNGLTGTFVLFLIFVNLFLKFPENNIIDIAKYCIVFLFILVDPVFSFGSVFYWAAGSYNYLYAWLWILLWLTPYNLFWRNKNTLLIQNKAAIPLVLFAGFFAGWSSEFCIVFIVLSVISLIIAFTKKIKLPLWYYIGIISIVIGWLILYKCPGLQKRSESFEEYLSIIDILKLGPYKIFLKLIDTYNIVRASFYYESFLLISIFILLSNVFNKSKIKDYLISFLMIAIMLATLRLFDKLFYIPLTFIICIFFSRWYKSNKKISNYYLVIAATLFVQFLFVGATIQISIPRRASFQYTLLNLILISIIMDYFFKNIDRINWLVKLSTILCVGFLLIFSLFVLADSINMYKKWNAMELSIQNQKEIGLKDISIDKNTFISHYWSYGDWGNPTEDIHDWVNERYSQYYGVSTIVSE